MKNIFIRFRDLFLDWFFRVRRKSIHNEVVCEQPVEDIPDLIAQSIFQLKKAAAVTDRGVDYAKLAADDTYLDFRQRIAPCLKMFDISTLNTEQEKLAFWINLYNLLTLDAVIQANVRKSVTEGWFGVIRFFRQAAYEVGGLRFSLEDIEHGILRANHGLPYFPGKQFANEDPRCQFAMDEIDPRIHFALNCASRSSPPIAYYTSDHVHEQLEQAAVHFIGSETKLEKSGVVLIIPRIFKWYLRDFGGRLFMLAILMNYLPENNMRRKLIENFKKDVMVQLAPYDWGLNSL